MIPVNTILEVGQHFDALGFSVLYNPLLGGEPERKTFVFLRDSDGNIAGSIFTDAKTLSEVIR